MMVELITISFGFVAGWTGRWLYDIVTSVYSEPGKLSNNKESEIMDKIVLKRLRRNFRRMNNDIR